MQILKNFESDAHTGWLSRVVIVIVIYFYFYLYSLFIFESFSQRVMF